jgi:hypothetical protein
MVVSPSMIKRLENVLLNGQTRTHAGAITVRSSMLTSMVISYGRSMDSKIVVRKKPMVDGHLQDAFAEV